MTNDDINRLFTWHVENFIAEGYAIDAALMAMQRNPHPQVILRKGKDYVWVSMERHNGYNHCAVPGWAIYTAKKAEDNHEKPGRDAWSLSNRKLEAKTIEYFFCLNDRNPYYVGYDEAIRAHSKRIGRTWKKGGPLWKRPQFKEFTGKRLEKAKLTAGKWMKKNGFPEGKYEHVKSVGYISNMPDCKEHGHYRITLENGNEYIIRAEISRKY